MLNSITTRDDKWNEKGNVVNDLIKNKSSDLKLGFIDNSNISSNCLNGSGLHLNSYDSATLAKNFLRAINL